MGRRRRAPARREGSLGEVALAAVALVPGAAPPPCRRARALLLSLRSSAGRPYLTGGDMAPRRSPKSGSPGPGSRREAKHGGNKNGKKEGISGSSFFTWFMVIALLGVWTSVAVVWFELVDYEEVLAKAKDFRYNLSEVLQGKLGIYDADGDGDFDVEDAKVLLGLKEKSIPEQPSIRDTEEVMQPVEEPHVRAEHRTILEPESEPEPEPEPDDEIESLLREVLKSQLEQESETNGEHAHEETYIQENEENNEIPDIPIIEEEYNEELGDKIPEVLESRESFQEEPVSDYEVEEPDVDDTPVTYEYDTHVEEDVYQPEDTDDTELIIEDAVEHNTETFSEDMEYADEHDLENEDFIEARQADEEPLIEHYDETIQDAREHVEDATAAEPHETESPVHTEDYSNDEIVDT